MELVIWIKRVSLKGETTTRGDKGMKEEYKKHWYDVWFKNSWITDGHYIYSSTDCAFVIIAFSTFMHIALRETHVICINVYSRGHLGYEKWVPKPEMNWGLITDSDRFRKYFQIV